METQNKKSFPWFKTLVILLLLSIAISCTINTFYLFSINTKLSLLPNMDFTGLQDSLKQIGDSLNVGVLDIFK